VDAIATQIWEIDTDESHLIIFKGTYSQMKEEREKELARQSAAEAVVADTRKKDTPKAKSASTKEERQRIAKVQKLENSIAALEAELSEIGRQLENPPKDAGAVVNLAKDYDRVQKEMDVLLAEWEGLQ
jgi:ATPase subunit of ABC transporter with duplicated ATPase domains